jgi:hypothetical protein
MFLHWYLPGYMGYHKISAMAFLISSLLWFSMMFMFWLWLPRTIYRRNVTFKDHFTVSMQDHHMRIQMSVVASPGLA